MARLTIFFGIILILLGLLTYMGTGSKAPTSLIPAWTGIVLALCGALARTEDMKRRMLWMHVAVTVGLLGFLGTIGRGPVALVRMHNGVQYPRPLAVYEATAMCALLLVFTVLCVQSFIAARRARA
jgi:hypothetical protein